MEREELLFLADDDDEESCDVTGCKKPVVNCIGGEVYHCADHGDEAAELFAQYRSKYAG